MNAEATTRTEHGDGFASFHAGTPQHLEGRGQRISDHADFGRIFFVIEPVRQLDEIARRQLDVFRITTVAFATDLAAGVFTQRFELRQAVAASAAIQIIVGRYPIARRKAGHAGAQRHNLGGNFMADDARKWHLHTTGFDVLNGEPRTTGQHARYRLAGPRRRIGHIAHFEGRVRRA